MEILQDLTFLPSTKRVCATVMLFTVSLQVVLAAVKLLVGIATSEKVIDLSNVEWTVSSASRNISVPGSLPSQVHLDLYDAHAITDPYFGQNELNLRWIAASNWTYRSAPIAGLFVLLL